MGVNFQGLGICCRKPRPGPLLYLCLRLAQGGEDAQSTSGAAQVEADADSSIEDSLPVPAKSSSGGHRHRKKSSRRRAKRRRGESSSSSTGTSSGSSGDEADASLGLYWGFGEPIGGLPKWAWQRRANSHRARYGAILDCCDGRLVPDVKVSTNSVRDIIPGAHLSSKLRSRILDGRYVDIFDLAPPTASLDALDKAISAPKRQTALKKSDRTFERWLDSFQVFAGVVSASYPRRALYLFVYLSIVRSAHAMAGAEAAILYDENFRRRAGKIPTARWDRRDLDVWTTYVVPHFERKALEQPKHKAAPVQPGRKRICWDFNKGECQRQPCKYPHVCDTCGGSHPATNCQGGKRPFRGGKGGAPQPPKATPSTSSTGIGK
ncbi:XP_034954535.1uncharacterized protein LOC118076098 [Podarcis lilfordi]|uniref:XP_034954535.1uncharacterized protein LOC118076098 n=1 Tax=Podarcis lilfordi TaxID=74358 RepID=A0AA35NUS2_9SAUR|nr:XP_034954535.1uncharacterized protein LOC118076098 [Podarcis lilfordi]